MSFNAYLNLTLETTAPSVSLGLIVYQQPDNVIHHFTFFASDKVTHGCCRGIKLRPVFTGKTRRQKISSYLLNAPGVSLFGVRASLITIHRCDENTWIKMENSAM